MLCKNAEHKRFLIVMKSIDNCYKGWYNDNMKGDGTMTFKGTQEALEYYVLTYLSMRESYGAQMFENIAKGIDVSLTTLYNVIKKLEAAGKISITQAVQDGVACNLCNITTAGKRHLNAFLKR